MDQELRAYLEELEARMETRSDERFAQMKTQVETEGRQTRVLVEGLHDNIRLLAEGVLGVTERLETFQAETARGFQEVKAMLAPYYRNLDGRVQSVEDDTQSLNRRLKVLEGRADRQTEDVLESIRKKFGKTQA